MWDLVFLGLCIDYLRVALLGSDHTYMIAILTTVSRQTLPNLYILAVFWQNYKDLVKLSHFNFAYIYVVN